MKKLTIYCRDHLQSSSREIKTRYLSSFRSLALVQETWDRTHLNCKPQIAFAAEQIMCGHCGRVVLTTVSHLSNDLYDLTLNGEGQQSESLDVTGVHLFYTNDRGWVAAAQLYIGEIIQGARGDLTVASLLRDFGIYTVYNLTVEADHVYYVGDLPALVHNDCSANARELRDNMERNDQYGNGDAAHIVPSGDHGGIIEEMQQILDDVDIDINDPENGFYSTDPAHDGTHTAAFLNYLYESLTDAAGSYEDVADALINALEAAQSGLFGG